MPSPGLVARFGRARRAIARLRRLAELPFEEFVRDEDTLILAERLLHIVLESILDISAFIVARSGETPGPTYRGVMEAAARVLGLEGELRRVALAMPGMRNILVHQYAEIRYDILYEAITTWLGSLEEILALAWRRALELDP